MLGSVSLKAFVFSICLLSTGPLWAADSPDKAEELMQWQLAAIVDNDQHNFIKNGNRAFKELMEDFIFESFTMQHGAKLKEGFTLSYLGSIKRLGMVEYVWKISFTNYKYELLGSVTLAHEFVVGFKLD